ncbi:MAG: hypothetical protein EOO38_19670 [Cytophagaceae bacterium]|nr:MAG: hypothetical protein EOO38_19670 [Cytophagaceae bacterium]
MTDYLIPRDRELRLQVLEARIGAETWTFLANSGNDLTDQSISPDGPETSIKVAADCEMDSAICRKCRKLA